MTLHITKRDGTKEAFNADRINKSIERACRGLTDPISKVTQIATETRLTIYDGITTQEMDLATINAAVQNIQNDPEYDRIATRLMLKVIYKQAVGEYNNEQEELEVKHKEQFVSYIEKGIESGRIDPRMKELYDLNDLAQVLDLSRDELFP